MIVAPPNNLVLLVIEDSADDWARLDNRRADAMRGFIGSICSVPDVPIRSN